MLLVWCSSCFTEVCTIVPGEGAPGRVGGFAPHPRGAKRRQALVRIAAPGGSPYGKACPFSGREQPAHNAGRRAYRRLTAAFFLRPRDRLLETDRGAHSRTPLIPRGFPRFHPLPPARCRTDHVVGPGGVSRGPRRPGWLGRTLRRRVPPRSHASHENALGRVGPGYEITLRRTNQEHWASKIYQSTMHPLGPAGA